MRWWVWLCYAFSYLRNTALLLSILWFLVFKKYATISAYIMLLETFMYFWLIYSDRNNHIERIAIAVKNVVNCCVKSFFMVNEILE